ncbi:Uncharacterised protein [Vibrio cholerae]|nr:Uncharacterised protein [Vibrio cholerae]
MVVRCAEYVRVPLPTHSSNGVYQRSSPYGALKIVAVNAPLKYWREPPRFENLRDGFSIR